MISGRSIHAIVEHLGVELGDSAGPPQPSVDVQEGPVLKGMENIRTKK